MNKSVTTVALKLRMEVDVPMFEKNMFHEVPEPVVVLEEPLAIKFPYSSDKDCHLQMWKRKARSETIHRTRQFSRPRSLNADKSD